MIEILNLCAQKPIYPYDIKVDRSSILGNPFHMRDESGRKHVCELYKERFYKILAHAPTDREATELNRLKALYKKYNKLRLFCWCAPKQCHAEIIKEYIENETTIQSHT